MVKENWPEIRLLGVCAAVILRAARFLTPSLTEKLPGSSRHRMRKKGMGVEIENC